MRSLLSVTAVLVLLTIAVPSLAQSESGSGRAEYSVPQLQRIDRAVGILETAGMALEDYDIVLYAKEAPNFYLVTFTTSVVFAEDGPVRAQDTRMLFNDETGALVAIEVDPLPTPPAQSE